MTSHQSVGRLRNPIDSQISPVCRDARTAAEVATSPKKRRYRVCPHTKRAAKAADSHAAHGRQRRGRASRTNSGTATALQERLAEQGGSRPQEIGAVRQTHGAGPATPGCQTPQRECAECDRAGQEERQKELHRWKNDNQTCGLRRAVFLREPGNAFLDHVPLQAIQARGRQVLDPRLESDGSPVTDSQW